jgi:hypothetical protein
MSWATLYERPNHQKRATNNTYFTSPPLMSDGRLTTSWQPESVVNQRIQERAGLTTNWEYREYLQNHAQTIMSYNSAEISAEIPFFAAVGAGADVPSDHVPKKFQGIFDTSNPGFGLSNSDLKNAYLTREQLNARLVAPSVILPH